MNSEEITKNICRVCLDENVVLDWNATLYGYCDITYRDCFYKYSGLEYFASDPFPTTLCQICLNSLYNVHIFILKALESHKYLKETYPSNLVLDHSSFKEDIKYTPPEFETVLVEKAEIENIIDDHFVYDDEIKEVYSKIQTRSTRCRSYARAAKKEEICETKIEKSLKVTERNTELDLAQLLNKSPKKNKSETTGCKPNYDRTCGNLTLDNETTEDTKEEKRKLLKGELLVDNFKDVGQSRPKGKKKYKEIKKPRMCSICSKILHNKYAVQMHEKTHMENRERKETCKVCGLKFYDKRNLYSHKRVHKENREKTHKCEFCNKAFYNKGALNIHRRVHLGQMIPCGLCAKQYFRQIDLDRHMSSHSATVINSETKKRSRYFVRCKHCDKSILSTSFKSHTAAHLNEPLMKCSICNKEFFRRGSCVLHVKKIHQKTNEEYNDFIVLYKKNRISHLFLEQKADIQFTDN